MISRFDKAVKVSLEDAVLILFFMHVEQIQQIHQTILAFHLEKEFERSDSLDISRFINVANIKLHA